MSEFTVYPAIDLSKGNVVRLEQGERKKETVYRSNPDKVAEVQAGNEKAMNWFTGQAMKASQGKANPKMVTEIVRKKVLG